MLSISRFLSPFRNPSPWVAPVLTLALIVGVLWNIPAINAEPETPTIDPAVVFTDDFEIGDTSLWTDSVPPVLIEIVSPTDGSATNDATPTVTLSYLSVDGTGIDTDSLLLRFGSILRYMACTFGETGADCTPFEPLDDGLWPIAAEISDFAGRSSKQVGIELLIDTGSPSIRLDGPLDGLLTNDPSVRFTGSVDEAVELFLDGDPVALDGDLRFDHPVTLVEGSQVRRLTARDAAGNTDEIARALTLDTLAPDAIVRAGVRVVEGVADTLDVTGDAGAAEAGATVTITNLRSGTSVEVVADGDGAFAASIAGRDGDRLRFDIADAVGNAGEAVDILGPFVVPTDPSATAPPIDPTIATRPIEALAFLYSGADPIQVGSTTARSKAG